MTLTRTKAVTFISQNHCSTFILKNQLASFSYQHSISFTYGLQYHRNLEKLACTDYVDFGKSQDRVGRFSWTENDSNYLDINLKVFKREDKNAEFRLRQNLSMGEADFKLFIRQRNQQLLQQIIFSEKKICLQLFNLHCAKTWRSN